VDFCSECRQDIIDTQQELDELKAEALQIVTAHIGPNKLEEIPVRLKNETVFGVVPNVLGLTASREDLTLLLIESGIPKSFALAILCHEFGHVILWRNHLTLKVRASAGSHPLIIEEGFCEVLNALALQSRFDPVARWQSFLLPVNPDPIYGEGFRMMWKAAQEAGSVAALLEQVCGERVPFRGPLIHAVVDEHFCSEGLIPVADVGRGDPVKGPLRGTAVRAADASPTVSSGPRLRGTALSVAEDRERVASGAQKGRLRGAGLSLVTRETEN